MWVASSEGCCRTVDVDVTTLVIAVVGLGLSLVSLTWQIVEHFLTGHRVTVELLWGGVGNRGVVTGPVQGTLDAFAQQGFTDLVVAVRARNVGRLPVDVKGFDVQVAGSISFSLGPEDWHLNPRTPHRLEAGSEATFYIPLDMVMQAIHASEAIQPYSGRIRARAQLATGRTIVGKWTSFPKS
jgi:hypothetical protein